jgi:alkylhydroperoxidase family enzyme
MALVRSRHRTARDKNCGKIMYVNRACAQVVETHRSRAILAPQKREIARMDDQRPASKAVLVTTNNIPQLRPELMAGMAAFSKVFKDNRTLSERLVEMMRLRIAFHNQCRPCMSMRYATAVDDGLTEGLICSLERPQEAPDMTPAERAAVMFADKFASNHLSITEADRLALCDHFTPEQVAEIAMQVAMFVGFGRMGAVFDTGESYPVGERHTDGTPLTPWGVNNPNIIGAPKH